MTGEFFGPEDKRTVSYLGRTVEWKEDGIHWTHGQKYVTKLLKEWGMEQCSIVATPVVSEHEQEVREKVDMSPMDAQRFRTAAALVNYIAQDRPDLCVTSCRLAQCIAHPKVGDEARLKRCIRYLRGCPVVSIVFKW